MKILIVRLSSFGDVIHTFPALTDLAALRPDVEVDWLVEESFASLARLHPTVAAAVTVAERRLRWPPRRWPAYFAARRRLREQLRQGRYDLVVDMQGLVKSALIARLATTSIAGYDAKSIREPLASRLYQRRFTVAKRLHAVERNRHLLAAAIGYEMPSTAAKFGLDAKDREALPGLADRFCLIVHNASWSSKLWPEGNWQRLVSHLAAKRLPVVLPWGTEEERARASRIAAASKDAIVLPHRLDGTELAGVTGRARCTIGLDSGLMHLAAALDVPGVWLFGPTDPGLTGPCGETQAVIRSRHPDAPCRTRDCAHAGDGETCMDMIDFDRVAAAVNEVLERTRA